MHYSRQQIQAKNGENSNEEAGFLYPSVRSSIDSTSEALKELERVLNKGFEGSKNNLEGISQAAKELKEETQKISTHRSITHFGLSSSLGSSWAFGCFSPPPY